MDDRILPPSREALDLDNYFPMLLTALSNKLSSAASQLYMGRFGVGVTEWRVMSATAVQPGLRPHDICNLVGMDKGAVAKAVRTLMGRGLLLAEARRGDGRSKSLALTDAGWALHAQIMELALHRQAILLAPLSDTERQQLNAFMHRLLGQVPALKQD